MNFLVIIIILWMLYMFLPSKVLAKIKIKKSNKIENPLDMRTTNALKGLLAILVVANHFCYYYPDGSNINIAFYGFLAGSGTVTVGLFLFLSGYGLAYSYKKHGDKYLLKVLLIKIPVLYLSFVFANLLGWALLFRHLPFNIGDILNIWPFGSSPLFLGRNGWFAPFILGFYALFCIVCFVVGRFTKNFKWHVIAYAIACVTVFVVAALLGGGPSNIGYDISGRGFFCFALGLVYLHYYKQINAFVARYPWRVTLVCLFTCAVSAVLWLLLPNPQSTRVPVEIIISLASCILVVVVINKINIHNKIGEFIGKTCLWVYLLHLVFQPFFAPYAPYNNLGLPAYNNITPIGLTLQIPYPLFVLTATAATLLCAYLLTLASKYTSKGLKAISRKSTPKEQKQPATEPAEITRTKETE